MTNKPRKAPVSAGEIPGEFLREFELSQSRLAAYLGWTSTKVSQLVRNQIGVTPATALALSDAFGNSPEFWLNAQRATDLWKARRLHRAKPRLKEPISA